VHDSGRFRADVIAFGRNFVLDGRAGQRPRSTRPPDPDLPPSAL